MLSMIGREVLTGLAVEDPRIETACAALVAGEPQRARRLLDGVEGSEAAAARVLVWALDVNWWPGPMSAARKLDPPPTMGATVETLRGMWLGYVLPTSLMAAQNASNAGRAGAEHGQRFLDWVRDGTASWFTLADETNTPAAGTHAALVLAEVARRAGLREAAEAELCRAGSYAARAGAVGMGACRLAAGDLLLTPRQSPETLGFDLDWRADPPVLGDPEARVAAAEHYRAARRRSPGPTHCPGSPPPTCAWHGCNDSTATSTPRPPPCAPRNQHSSRPATARVAPWH